MVNKKCAKEIGVSAGMLLVVEPLIGGLIGGITGEIRNNEEINKAAHDSCVTSNNKNDYDKCIKKQLDEVESLLRDASYNCEHLKDNKSEYKICQTEFIKNRKDNKNSSLVGATRFATNVKDGVIDGVTSLGSKRHYEESAIGLVKDDLVDIIAECSKGAIQDGIKSIAKKISATIGRKALQKSLKSSSTKMVGKLAGKVGPKLAARAAKRAAKYAMKSAVKMSIRIATRASMALAKASAKLSSGPVGVILFAIDMALLIVDIIDPCGFNDTLFNKDLLDKKIEIEAALVEVAVSKQFEEGITLGYPQKVYPEAITVIDGILDKDELETYSVLYLAYLEDRGFSNVSMDDFINNMSIDLDAEAEKLVDENFEVYFEMFQESIKMMVEILQRKKSLKKRKEIVKTGYIGSSLCVISSSCCLSFVFICLISVVIGFM